MHWHTSKLESLLKQEISLEWLTGSGFHRSVSLISFAALVFFGLSPLVVAVKAVFHCSFDLMVSDYWTQLFFWAFPFMCLCSALVYLLAVLRAKSEGWSPLKRTQEHPTFLLFFLLVLWMLVNFFWIHGPAGQLPELTFESFYLVIGYFLCFFVLAAGLTAKKLKAWLLCLYAVVSGVLAPVAYFLWKYMTASPAYIWSPSVTCVFTNTNYYGYYLSVSIGLTAALFATAKKRWWRLLYGVILAANSWILYYNNTTGGLIASVSACLFLIIALRIRDGRFSKWTFAALALVLICVNLPGVISALTTNGAGNVTQNMTILTADVQNIAKDAGSEESLRAGSGRWILWVRVLSLIKAHPLLGIGFEGVYVLGLHGYTTCYRPHNEFLQYALFYGIPAAVLYFAGCLSVYLRALRYKAQLDDMTLAALTAAFGYLVGSFFGLTVYNTAPYLFIMLGLGYVHRKPNP